MARLAWCGALIVLAAGCGGNAPAPKALDPGQEPKTGGVEAPESGGEESAPAEASEAELAVPRAKVRGVKPVEGTPGDRRVKISFENPTKSSCTFTSYVLVWPGGRKTVEEKPFEIPPGEKRPRSLRMHPSDGDLSSLTEKSAEIEVTAGCASGE